MMIYEYTTSLSVEGNGPSEEFETHVFELADALIDLEESTRGLLDSTVGADSSTRTLEIEMTIEADTFEDAGKLALATLHAAVRNSGGEVSGWEHKLQTDEATQKRLLASH